MSLLQENRRVDSGNKKIYMMGGIALVVLIFIIVALLALVSSLNKNKVGLIINNKKYQASNFLITKEIDNNKVVYIGIEDLTKTLANGYTYRSGNRDVEDVNQCYVSNSTLQESTFFKVGTKEIYKVSEEDNEVEYYDLNYEIIKENGKIYMPIESCRLALNTEYSVVKNQYYINSVEYLEGFYNKKSSNSFVPDNSIVWNTNPCNKKILKYGLVIVKDETGKLGVSKVSSSTDSKKKVTTVTTSPLITPKYDSIVFVEKYGQLIVETENGKGVIQLTQENDNFTTKTLISPQYDDLKQINDKMFLVSKLDETSTSSTSSSNNSDKNKKFGIIDINRDVILPIEYQQIGIDISKFTNNDLNSKYIIYDNLIPVKKDDLWGFVNLNGQVIINMEYTDLGCTESNSNSNVLIIPDIDGIVVMKDKNYGIITKTGKVLVRSVLTKVYKEDEDRKDVYYMIYNDVNRNILDFFNTINKKQLNTQVEENTEKVEENKESKKELSDDEIKTLSMATEN